MIINSIPAVKVVKVGFMCYERYFTCVQYNMNITVLSNIATWRKVQSFLLNYIYEIVLDHR